jgi:FtsZ-binding cell division protein ZapB
VNQRQVTGALGLAAGAFTIVAIATFPSLDQAQQRVGGPYYPPAALGKATINPIPVLQGEITTLKGQVAELQGEVQSLAGKCTQLQSTVAAVQTQCNTLQANFNNHSHLYSGEHGETLTTGTPRY